MILISTTHTHTSKDGSQTTTEIPLTWFEIRAVRDDELDKSDWRAVQDRTLPNTWEDYRKFLRDLPQYYDEPREAATALNEYVKPEDWR